MVRPLRARHDPFLAFHLDDPYEVFEYKTARPRILPDAYVIGPQTGRLADLHLKGHTSVFSISFQPAGLLRLFGCSMTELTDHAYDAADVIGAPVRDIHAQLLGAFAVDGMVQVVERALLARLSAAQAPHPVERAADLVLRSHGTSDLSQLAATSGLSERQFERRFAARVGVAPKLYSRIVRFTFAMRLKEQRPLLTWAEVSHAAGYFDQMHLGKDFKALAGDAPSGVLRASSALRDIFPSEP